MKHKFDFQKRYKNKKYLSELFLACISTGAVTVSIFGATAVHAETVAELSPVTVLAIRDSSIPEPLEKEGYAIVNLNIREQPDSESKTLGKYQKGDKVNIIDPSAENK